MCGCDVTGIVIAVVVVNLRLDDRCNMTLL